MRSLKHTCLALLFVSAAALSGCLVSDQPILDALNGKASPLNEGLYQVCTGSREDDSSECNVFSVTRDTSGSYTLAMENEAPAMMRFRRVARKAYAVQSAEDDSYTYYFGAGDSQRFLMTLMNCPDLPSALRARLIAKGDLSTEHDDFESCTVNTLKGLTASAKAYARGETIGDDPAVMVMTPAAVTE